MNIWDLAILQPMLNGLLLLYQLLFHNLTLTIVVFTILTRVLTYPLTAQSQKSTRKLAELQQSDAWKKTQEKYKGEREKLAQEQMKLYQEAGVSPFGSCLPLTCACCWPRWPCRCPTRCSPSCSNGTHWTTAPSA